MIYELIVKESTLPRTDTFYSIPSGGSILDVFEFSFTSTQIQSDTFCSFESLRYLPEISNKVLWVWSMFVCTAWPTVSRKQVVYLSRAYQKVRISAIRPKLSTKPRTMKLRQTLMYFSWVNSHPRAGVFTWLWPEVLHAFWPKCLANRQHSYWCIRA